jgi:hypothetical protein
MSGRVQLLLNKAHIQWMHEPLVSPEGKHLAFQVETYESNVWLLENFRGSHDPMEDCVYRIIESLRISGVLRQRRI